MALVFSEKLNATDTQDFLDKVKNTLVSAGWTLHDDLSGGSPYGYVLYSDGESGSEMRCYVHLYQTTNAVIGLIYAGWDNATHAGTYYAGSTTYSKLDTDDDGSFDAYITASKDSFVAMAYVSAKWNFLTVGMIEPFTDSSEGELQSGVSSGSSVVLTLAADEAATFIEGMDVQIIDEDHREWVNITAVNAGSNQITVDSLSYAYSAGARIGNKPHKWVVYNTKYNQCFLFRHSTEGAGDDVSQVTTVETGFLNSSNADPSPTSGWDDCYPLWPVLVSDFTALGGFFSESFLYMRADNNNTSHEHTMAVNQRETGTSTGSNTSTTLNDTSKSWSTDEWSGKICIITAGTGQGQARAITANTATGLTVSAWTTTPDATSEYVICDEAWLYFYFNQNSSLAGSIRMA